MCAVSSSLELFERAAAAGAQLVLVHHGLLWDNEPRVIDARMRRRLQTLFDADITLAGVPPRARRAPGDRQQRAARARARRRGRRAVRRDRRRRPLRRPVASTSSSRASASGIGREPLVFAHGPERIERVAVISGGAARYLADAAARATTCYLTGEPAEPSLHLARELGITLRRRRPLRDRAARRPGAGRTARGAVRPRVGVRRRCRTRFERHCRRRGEYSSSDMHRSEERDL